jgi:hypothetical protein
MPKYHRIAHLWVLGPVFPPKQNIVVTGSIGRIKLLTTWQPESKEGADFYNKAPPPNPLSYESINGSVHS